MKPRLYDRNMQFVCILHNASKISYTHAFNDLYTASFELPFDDQGTWYCQPHFIVDIFDDDKSVGKYRIVEEPEAEITKEGTFIKYHCEHVLAFLLNDVIDGYLELGGKYRIEGPDPIKPIIKENTKQVIYDLLEMQTVKRWKYGNCVFDYFLTYTWENTNLLDAIFSVAASLQEKYHWTYDTSTYPWSLSLTALNTTRSCEIKRKHNMQSIKRSCDSTALCTRLYCRGSGEGVNQVGISSINPTGQPYIEADTIGTYGVLSSHYIDKSETEPANLYAKGLSILNESKHPRYTYTAKAVDLSKITAMPTDFFEEGKVVRVYDDESNLDMDALIIEVTKPDIDGDPLNMDITISNKASDVASSIENLSRLATQAAQSSQGKTNLHTYQYADNADTSYPARFRVYIPEDTLHINVMLLAWKLRPYRYSGSSGVYEGGTASSVSIWVDGTYLSLDNPSVAEKDITSLMFKDVGGRIARGVWHEIAFYPSSSTRIEANLFAQTFITPHSGGNF